MKSYGIVKNGKYTILLFGRIIIRLIRLIIMTVLLNGGSRGVEMVYEEPTLIYYNIRLLNLSP